MSRVLTVVSDDRSTCLGYLHTRSWSNYVDQPTPFPPCTRPFSPYMLVRSPHPRPRYGAAADTLSAVAQTHLRIVGLCVTCSLHDPGPRVGHDRPPPRACAHRCPRPCDDLVATWPRCEMLSAHLRTHGCLVVPCPVLCRVVHAPPRPLTARQAYIKVPQLHLAGTTPTLWWRGYLHLLTWFVGLGSHCRPDERAAAATAGATTAHPVPAACA